MIQGQCVLQWNPVSRVSVQKVFLHTHSHPQTQSQRTASETKAKVEENSLCSWKIKHPRAFSNPSIISVASSSKWTSIIMSISISFHLLLSVNRGAEKHDKSPPAVHKKNVCLDAKWKIWSAIKTLTLTNSCCEDLHCCGHMRHN